MKESLIVLTGVLYIVKQRWLPILKAVVIPMIIITAIDTVVDHVNDLENMAKPLRVMLSAALGLLSLFQYTYVAVATHRIAILGIGSVPEWGFKKYTKREGMFFFYSVALMLLSIVVMSTTSFVQNFFVIVIPIIFAFYVSIRFSLVFPAIAIDKALTLKESWEYTRHKSIFMIMVTYIWPLMLFIPVLVISFVAQAVGGYIAAFVDILFSAVVSVVFTIILITSLSLAYLRIVDYEDS